MLHGTCFELTADPELDWPILRYTRLPYRTGIGPSRSRSDPGDLSPDRASFRTMVVELFASLGPKNEQNFGFPIDLEGWFS